MSSRSLYARPPGGRTRYTDALLDHLRTVGDPELDAIMDELVESHSVDAVNAVLRHLVTNATPVPAELPEPVARWLTHEALRLPAHADLRRLESASRVTVERGIEIALILSTVSLVLCYAAPKGAKTLTFTHRLDQNPYRRVAESAQFVLNVTAPGLMRPEGRGLPAIAKVRLLHAAIRHVIKRTGRWEEAALGAPINQEDMLGALSCFSWVIVEALARLGEPLDPDLAEDYIYSWSIIGELLGIRRDVLPTTMADASELAYAIADRQLGPSPEGTLMTRALVDMHRSYLPAPIEGVVPALIRHLLGDPIADMLEVPRTRWDGVLHHEEQVVHWLGHLGGVFRQGHNPLRHLVERVGVFMLTQESIALAGFKRSSYEIPASLLEHWEPAGRLTRA